MNNTEIAKEELYKKAFTDAQKDLNISTNKNSADTKNNSLTIVLTIVGVTIGIAFVGIVFLYFALAAIFSA